MIGPLDITLDSGGYLIGTLGRMETEVVAALIIRWHQVNHQATWQPIARCQLLDLIEHDPITQEWARNPFWRPGPWQFLQQGFIKGWCTGSDTHHNPGTLTDKFHAAIAKRFGARTPA